MPIDAQPLISLEERRRRSGLELSVLCFCWILLFVKEFPCPQHLAERPSPAAFFAKIGFRRQAARDRMIRCAYLDDG
jgi:hypothetical protein